MSSEPIEVNAENLLPKIAKIVATIRKNMQAKGLTPPEIAAIGSYLVAEAFLEMSGENDHPREVFLMAVDMLDSAFAHVEDEEETPNENAD